MSNRFSDAISRLSIGESRNSMGRPPPSPGNKRNSGLDPSTIQAMFPDAAAAIATQKAKFTQENGKAPESNRNSAAFEKRSSFVAPTIAAPTAKENISQQPSSPWTSRNQSSEQQPIARPKSSAEQQPMGQFAQSNSTSGPRSARPQPLSSTTNIQSTTVTSPGIKGMNLPPLSPYNAGNGNWASMMNTPMVPNFNQQASLNQADMVANATAMKLAAFSTVNSRIALDDARKYRRGRSAEGQSDMPQPPLSAGLPSAAIPATNVVMVNEHGQVLNAQQVAALQANQSAAMAGRRSRPNSPGMMLPGAGAFSGIGFASPQNNGFLAAYDGASPLINNGFGLGQFGIGSVAGHEGYLSDHSDVRGRSPRGKRGGSRPPEDPTDPSLLQDIPSWLRSLRLHKYTDNLKDLQWAELVELDDAALEKRGVNALGARRKMLKVC